jgi:hypothetical protein
MKKLLMFLLCTGLLVASISTAKAATFDYTITIDNVKDNWTSPWGVNEGAIYTGSATFYDELLTGSGDEYAPLISLSGNIGTFTYAEANAAGTIFPPMALYSDGVMVGMFSMLWNSSMTWYGTLWGNDYLGPDDGEGGYYVTGAISYTEVAPVPEPATMLLLGSGLIGLAGFRRKKSMK